MNTIKIGNQEWMAENLSITDEGLGKDHWKNPKNGEVYYSWDAAMRVAKTIPGWHLPTAEEWDILCLRDHECAKKLYDTLMVLPVGYSNVDSFIYVGSFAYFWSATEYCGDSAYLRGFNTSDATDRHISYKSYGLSVRLIKD